MGALEKLNISSPLASRHAETGLLIHRAAAPHLLLLLKGAAKSATMEGTYTAGDEASKTTCR